MNEKLNNALKTLRSGAQQILARLHPLLRKLEPHQRRLLQWGGLKLKLIAAIALIVVLSIGVLNHFITSLMERSITAKAFEVGQMAIERVGDASFNAIVERTYENRVNLMEMIKETREANIEGFLDISIYAVDREAGKIAFRFFGGFNDKGDPLSDEVLIKRLLESKDRKVIREPVTYGEEGVEAYRLVRPVIFNFGGQQHVVGAVVLHYDREAIAGPVRQAQRISTVTTLIVLILAIAVAWWLSARLSRPILDVAQAAKKVADNDLNIQLNIRTADEIEALADEFNRMVKGLRERERMQKFVSGSAMDLIKDDSAKMELGGSYRTQTFLFTDIRGFTAMSENRKPDEVVSIINFYLHLQTQIIRKHGGDIDKFVGDEVMATFEGADDLKRAIEAGKELQAAIAAENQKRTAAGQVIVQVGAGVNRGEVIVGNMGSKDRMDFTSIGAAVNMAARLCSKATPGQVLILKEIYAQTGADLGAKPAGAIEVKGFTGPVEIVAIGGAA